jgi:hypothetical protein
MKRALLIATVLDFVLLSPAVLFMAALIARNLPLHEMAANAQHIVLWYAARLWTLWVLLLALPFVVLTTGSVALSRDWTEMPNAPHQLLMGLTFTAAGILVVVIFHMLAN